MSDLYVKSLLHLNVDFADVGGSHTWTGYGNAQIDAAVKKFGAGSLLLDGDGDYIDTPDHADWAMGSGDFTIDTWFKRARAQIPEFLFGQVDPTGANANCSITCWFAGADEYTVSLLHMNGADASSTFLDSPWFSPVIWTPHGDAKLSTTSPKLGSACGVFDGTGDYIDTPDTSLWTMGSDNFTIDFWVKRGATGAAHYIMGQMGAAGSLATTSFFVYFSADNKMNFGVASGSTAYTATSTGTITDTNTWHHIECVRDGNTLRLFIDGSPDGTANVTGVTVNNSGETLSWGRLGAYASNLFNGRLDECRISKGIARHTSAFTPSTSEYIYDRLGFFICSGSTGYGSFSSVDISDINWHHMAGVRSGNNLLLFIDGVLEATTDITGITVNDSAYKFAIGREGEQVLNYYKGNIDEPRISKGIARWTSGFTPPIHEYDELEMFDLNHANAIGSVALTQVHNLAVANMAHANAIGNVDLIQNILLIVNALLHTHSVGGLSLTQIHQLIVDAINHSHGLGGVTLLLPYNLIVESIQHSHVIQDGYEIQLTQIEKEILDTFNYELLPEKSFPHSEGVYDSEIEAEKVFPAPDGVYPFKPEMLN